MTDPCKVFISYARKDDRTPSADKTGWVQFFDTALELELEQRGLAVDLWRDTRDVDKNDFWDDVIQKGIDDAELLIAVISPTYIQREYCLRELNEFLEAARSRDEEGAATRIYKILIRPVPSESQPEPIQRKEGFTFYSYDRESDREQLFYLGYKPQDEYWDVLTELGHSLEKKIRAVPDRKVGGEAESKGRIYLADVSDDRTGAHRKIREELKKRGYEVVPRKGLPKLAEETRQVIEGAMREALVSIHLLGGTAGFVPEGAADPIVPLQLQCAAERARTGDGFRRLIWLPLELQCRSERQRALVTDLRSGEALLDSDELVGEPLQKFLEALLDSLPAEPAPREGRARSVVLLCEAADETRALDFQEALVERGFEAILPVFAATAEERETAEGEDLRASEGVIVVYSDEGRERWVRSQLDRLEDWRLLSRDCPFAATAVWLAGPPTPRKDRYRTPKADFILRSFDSDRSRDDGPIAIERLDDFLEQIAGGVVDR